MTKRNYLTNEEFVERFSASLLGYLNDTIPVGEDSKNHLQDLVAHTGVFTEVFWRVVSDF
jgi:hypothetical protein